MISILLKSNITGLLCFQDVVDDQTENMKKLKSEVDRCKQELTNKDRMIGVMMIESESEYKVVIFFNYVHSLFFLLSEFFFFFCSFHFRSGHLKTLKILNNIFEFNRE